MCVPKLRKRYVGEAPDKYTHKMNVVNSNALREIQRLYSNSMRNAPPLSCASVAEKIETIVRKHKFKEHALGSVLLALGLQRYAAKDAIQCFDMDKHNVAEYLMQKKWNYDAANLFVEYVWFDRLQKV